MRKKHDPHPKPGSLLRFLRLSEGLTMKQLSKFTKVSINNICHMERGLYGPFPRAKAVADYFEITVDALVRDDYTALAQSRMTPVTVSAVHRTRERSAQIKRMETGDKGEAYVLKMEYKRLSGTRFENLVNGNYSDDFSAGFDIMSFSENGVPIYIEVKSTLNPDGAEPFFMTAGERRFAEHCLRNGLDYRLYRVYNLARKPADWKYEVYTAEEILGFQFEVEDYRVKEV